MSKVAKAKWQQCLPRKELLELEQGTKSGTDFLEGRCKISEDLI